MVSIKVHPLLDRPEHQFDPPDLEGETVLVTGSSGSIGRAVSSRLVALGARVAEFDIEEGLDVTNLSLCEYVLRQAKPRYVIHLAAHKYATTAEDVPYDVANLNIHGTQYLCVRAAAHGVENVLVASTCKAVEPETVYGASKLVAERIALTRGFTVARLFNVIDSAGNVFAIWRDKIAAGQPLQVTPCRRYFISGQEAADYLVHLLSRPRGYRYAPFPGAPVEMEEMAKRMAGSAYPVEHTPPRRGDRVVEPLHGRHEDYELVDGRLMVITSPHDGATRQFPDEAGREDNTDSAIAPDLSSAAPS